MLVAVSFGSLRADPYVDNGWELIGDLALETTKVEQPKGAPEPVSLHVLEAPGISEARYLVAGEVRYEDASGFLEMWNHFKQGRYFSRTLGESGPMGKLSGTSDWRSFMLPFNAERGMAPEKLEINVVLTGGGTVELREVRLYQTDVALPAAFMPPQSNAGKEGGGAIWAIAVAGITGAMVGGLLVWLWKNQQYARELRRMTAADL